MNIESNACCRALYNWKSSERECVLDELNSVNEFPKVSHILLENEFVFDVRKFNVRVMRDEDLIYFADDFNLRRECPPTPIDVLLNGLFIKENMIEHIWAFAVFCDKQTKKYAATAAVATAAVAAAYAADAADAAAYAADAVADADAAYAAYAATDAAAAAVAAAAAGAYAATDAARFEQYKFLVNSLKESGLR